jgi:hypothetical protein
LDTVFNAPIGRKLVSKQQHHQRQQHKKKTSRKSTPKKAATSTTTTVLREKSKSFHPPFEEFSIGTLDELLQLVNDAKLVDAVVEVSTAQDTPHVVCMQALTHVVVHSPESSSSMEAEHVYAMYQYCTNCKLAVRVL